MGIIFGANNIALDCNGFSIIGDGLGLDFGVSATGRDNIAVRNCMLDIIAVGIRLSFTNNSVIENNVLGDINNPLSLNQSGIELDVSSFNTIRNNMGGGEFQYV